MKNQTGAKILQSHGITKEYLLRKARLYYIMHNKEYWGYCYSCKYGGNNIASPRGTGCKVTDWDKNAVKTGCLLKFLPKEE